MATKPRPQPVCGELLSLAGIPICCTRAPQHAGAHEWRLIDPDKQDVRISWKPRKFARQGGLATGKARMHTR